MSDLWRLLLLLLATATLGMLTGHTLAFVSIGLLLYILWLRKRIEELRDCLRDRNPEKEDRFTGVLYDILAEFDRVRRHHHDRDRKLLAQLKRFQIAAMAIPDAVVLLGKHGSIEWANHRAGEYLGIHWPRDDGQRISNLLRAPELSRLVQNPPFAQSDERLETTLSHNRDRYLEFRVVPYGDDQRLLVARDVTEIRQTSNMRRDFIANASHELRTPLTVIAGYLESIESDEDATPVSAWKQIIGKMRTHTLRMQRLIDDLLKLSSLESVRSGEHREEVAVSELLSSIFNEAKVLSGDEQHIFYLETDTRLWLKGDQQGLYSAFSNLVFNAVQYTPARGVIRIRWHENDRGACMEVIDSGEGIASEHIPRLTERFYRVDKGRSRDQGGTGLGLAIVKHALANHGATLEIDSQPGMGSRFSCQFTKARLVRKQAPDEASISA